jgi:hypothetical protein
MRGLCWVSCEEGATMADRSVFIRREGEGFWVSVEPPLPGRDLDKSCDTFKQANGYAGMTARLHQLPLVILCSDAALDAVMGKGGSL